MQPDARDSLTGLLSRRSFEPAVADALAGCAEDGGVVALILVDIDAFKQVNDCFGYYAGDEVLRRVALELRATAYDEATVCRYGGDEFLVLCTDTTVTRAQEWADLIEARVASLVVNWEGHDIEGFSVSTGLACHPLDGSDVTELIDAADLAMLRKKRGGDDPPTAPMAVGKPVPKPRPGTDARARLQDDNG